MKKIGFVITGMPRSGTMYAARLFDALLRPLGARCGHESVFECEALLARREPWEWIPGPGVGDSSFLAAPILGELPPDVPIIHQVRDPVAVVRAVLGVQGLHRGVDPAGRPGPSPFRAWIHRHLPEIDTDEPEPIRAMRFWIGWNDAIRAARATRQNSTVVRLDRYTPGLLVDLAAMVGFDVTEAQAANALARIPADVNHGNRAGFDLASVRDCGTRRAFVDAARSYGFEL